MQEQQVAAGSENMTKIMPLVMKLMNGGGWDVVDEALQSEDPARPLGEFLAEMIMQVAQETQKRGMKLDMAVFLKDGGVVMRLLDLMEQHFDMPPEFSDEIFDEVVGVIEQSMGKGNQAGQNAEQPQEQAPMPPEQSLDQMGGM